MTFMFVFKRYETPSQISAKNTNINQNSDQTKTSKKLFDEKGSPRKLFIILLSVLLSTYCTIEAIFFNSVQLFINIFHLN